MNCLKCDKEHDGSFGSGKYCSLSCANSRTRTEETKKKISQGILKSEWWNKIDYSHNSNPNKIQKTKESWKKKRNWANAHISTIKKWIREERGEICEKCGLDKWNGKSLPMEVEHIDGNTSNNQPENLKILCPNCHSQTPTWRRKKIVLKR
jgi:hypothetical protein